MLLDVLEGLDEADELINVAADGEVVHGDLADVLLGVNDEGAAESNAVVEEDTVVGGDLLLEVRDEGDGHLAEAALLAGLHGPGKVGELRVDGAADDLAVELVELGNAVGELDDLGGADEGEVEGVEEEDEPLALVVIKGDGLEGAVGHAGGGREGGGGLLDSNLGHGNERTFVGDDEIEKSNR